MCIVQLMLWVKTKSGRRTYFTTQTPPIIHLLPKQTNKKAVGKNHITENSFENKIIHSIIQENKNYIFVKIQSHSLLKILLYHFTNVNQITILKSWVFHPHSFIIKNMLCVLYFCLQIKNRNPIK